jgi:hypothetical protein
MYLYSPYGVRVNQDATSRIQDESDMKTVAAFARQLDYLCVLTRQTLPDPVQLRGTRDAIAASRSHRNGHTHENRDVVKCVERFLRVLEAADGELTPEQITQLEEHVHHCLTTVADADELTLASGRHTQREPLPGT